MSKFTRGPWFIHPNGPKYAINQVSTNRHVAMVSCYKQFEEDEATNKANASLVLAAPDLYEALKAVEWLGVEIDHEEKTFTSSCLICGYLQREGGHHPDCFVRNALRKAEGGEG